MNVCTLTIHLVLLSLGQALGAALSSFTEKAALVYNAACLEVDVASCLHAVFIIANL